MAVGKGEKKGAKGKDKRSTTPTPKARGRKDVPAAKTDAKKEPKSPSPVEAEETPAGSA